MDSRYYLLQCPVRDYDWGNRSAGGTIARFLAAGGQTISPEQPRAELWMGDHPSAPALLLPDLVPLNRAIAENPRHFLGPRLAGRRERRLPFLFKILDAARPLSIQAHPDRELAVRLHREDPEHYPDSNHKPELAIGLDRAEALVGFRPPDQIAAFLNSYSEIAEICSPEGSDEYAPPFSTATFVFTPVPESIGRESEGWLQNRYSALMTAPAEEIARCSVQHLERIAGLKERGESTVENLWFERLHDLYGPADPGLFCVYFLNYISLEREQAVFLETNEPHAYLNGPILEIMAASDNVVRAGLTGKFRDVGTLLGMLEYRGGEPVLLAPQKSGELTATYETPAREFVVHRLFPTSRCTELTAADSPSILILLQGEIRLGFRERTGSAEPAETFGGGTVLFLPGDLASRGIVPRIEVGPESLLYRATVHPDF